MKNIQPKIPYRFTTQRSGIEKTEAQFESVISRVDEFLATRPISTLPIKPSRIRAEKK